MFWNRKKVVEDIKARAPQGTRIYAIGDIHGHAKLLNKMHEAIIEDAKHSNAQRKLIIYVGDYIDRGVESKEVIETLINNPMSKEGFEIICLMGNHEDAMINFMNSPIDMEIWLLWGGDATIRSYGQHLRDAQGHRIKLDELGRLFNKLVPSSHKEFLRNLKLSHSEGDYLFVHAGLRPGVPIDKQSREDMLTIREPFTASKKRFDQTVVFGHSIFEDPFHKNGRIAIDTGAYASGKLTCVVLESDEVKFISVNTGEENA